MGTSATKKRKPFMSRKTSRLLDPRYQKIRAILKRKLIPAALFSNEAAAQHRLRSRRRSDAMYLPEHVDNVERPDDFWKLAGARIRELDPERKLARANMRELMANR